MNTAPPVPTPTGPGGHWRWGVSGTLGWHFPFSTVTLGTEARVGYQFSELLSGWVFARGTLETRPFRGLAGLSSVGRHLHLGALTQFSFGSFYVAGGPVLAIGTAMSSEPPFNSGNGVTYLTSEGINPGIDLRVGLGPSRLRRRGFTLGLDALILLHPGTSIETRNPSFTRTTGSLISVAPMLMVGYETL